MAQQFELSEPGSISHLELHLHRIGDPVGTLAISLHEDNGGKPGNLIERADGVLARNIPSGVPEYTTFRLFTPVDLLSATPYWIVVAGNPVYAQGLPPHLPADADNQVIWTKEAGGYSFPRAKTTQDLIPVAGSMWVTNAGEHHYFKVVGS